MASEAAIKKALAPFAIALKFGAGGLGELTAETLVEAVYTEQELMIKY